MICSEIIETVLKSDLHTVGNLPWKQSSNFYVHLVGNSSIASSGISFSAYKELTDLATVRLKSLSSALQIDLKQTGSNLI